MPAFFALIGLIWKLLSREECPPSRSSSPLLIISLCLALFAYIVFSYFYIWTTAAAFLISIMLVLIVFRPPDLRMYLRDLAILGLGCAVILAPYAYLLSRRSHTMDDVQLLVRTRVPDLLRFPELVAGVAIVILAIGVFARRFEHRSTPFLIVLSLAISVFAVFNQQMITGQSLQPIHYQVFIGNYVAGLALVSAIGLYLRGNASAHSRYARASFAAIAMIAITWGFVECHYTVRVLDDVNVARDEQMPLARRLTDLAANDPNKYKTVVLHFGIAEADDLPTIAPQATLWSRHQHVFTSITTDENKKRYYQYLYFQGWTGDDLARSMKHGDFVSMIALFGWGRHTDRLNSDFKPLTYGEIDEEARRFDDYSAAFDPRNSPDTIVSFVVVRNDQIPDLSNFDRWYDRDDGQQFGPFTLYQAKLRPR